MPQNNYSELRSVNAMPENVLYRLSGNDPELDLHDKVMSLPIDYLLKDYKEGKLSGS